MAFFVALKFLQSGEPWEDRQNCNESVDHKQSDELEMGSGLAISVAMYQTDLKQRTFAFAQTLLTLYPRISKFGRPYEHIAHQLFRAGSSIGAHLEEGEVAVSTKDKGHKHANCVA